jgi:membrane associated rhomboid family serine protease
MIALCPYQVDTLYQRNPWGNLALVLVTSIISVAALVGALPDPLIEALVLDGFSPTGLLGYAFLHAGWMHLLGNMVFLFVFGNAICGVMNSWLYAAVYLLLGFASGVLHVVIDGHPAIGASGAISGIVGLYLAVYPTNTIRCAWIFLIRVGTTELSGWVLILGWLLLDLWGAVRGTGQVAYVAHLAGTVVGFALGFLLLRHGWIDLFEYDHPTLPDLIDRWREKKEA